MKVTNYNGISVLLNTDRLEIPEDIEDGILILTNDTQLKTSLKELIYEVAQNCEWCYPDVLNSKIGFLIMYNDLTRDIDINLVLEVVPPKYSDKDVDNVLITREIVDESIAFYQNKGYYCENIDTYKVELSKKEREDLIEFLQKYKN